MLKRDTVTVTNKAIGTTDQYGGYVAGLPTTYSKNVDVQPYGRELLQQKYGYDIECSKLMFCAIDSNIVEGTVILYKSVNYEVVKIPWDINHMEVVLNVLRTQ